MKYLLGVATAVGMLAFASPSMAQLVNGINGVGSPEAPIGTKAGGTGSSLYAPGEADAVAGAHRNVRDEERAEGKRPPVGAMRDDQDTNDYGGR